MAAQLSTPGTSSAYRTARTPPPHMASSTRAPPLALALVLPLVLPLVLLLARRSSSCCCRCTVRQSTERSRCSTCKPLKNTPPFLDLTARRLHNPSKESSIGKIN